MAICILADAADIDRAKLIELEYSSVEDLKKLNKNKKLVKKVGSRITISIEARSVLTRMLLPLDSSPRSTTPSLRLRFSSSRSLVFSAPVSPRVGLY